MDKEILIKIISGIILIIGLFLGITYYGHTKYNAGIEYQKTVYLKAELSAKEHADKLEEKLKASDLELIKSQKDADELRAKLAEKPTTVYIDRIKNADTEKCLNESGIFDMLNANTPTE